MVKKRVLKTKNGILETRQSNDKKAAPLILPLGRVTVSPGYVVSKSV
jgi:hypothetical protein